MFVILLTAQESGRVILGMLIDSRGKVCLRVPRSKANAPSADSSSQRRELHVKSQKSGKTIVCDTRVRQEVKLFKIW